MIRIFFQLRGVWRSNEIPKLQETNRGEARTPVGKSDHEAEDNPLEKKGAWRLRNGW